MCHRNDQDGWVRDKRVRDAGPWIGTYRDGEWNGQVSRHARAGADLVLAARWYEWLKANRAGRRSRAATAAPVPDGAMMIKEMYPHAGRRLRGRSIR